MFGFFLSDEDTVTRFDQVTQCSAETFKRFFHGMLEQGIYLAPSSYEAGFVSIAHSAKDIEKTIDAAAKVFSSL